MVEMVMHDFSALANGYEVIGHKTSGLIERHSQMLTVN